MQYGKAVGDDKLAGGKGGLVASYLYRVFLSYVAWVRGRLGEWLLWPAMSHLPADSCTPRQVLFACCQVGSPAAGSLRPRVRR